MKYAPFCWHTEDLYLPSLNYLYEGEVKTWYFIHPEDAGKYETYFKTRFREQLKHYPSKIKSLIRDLLYDLVTLIPPVELIK
jgi:hypothetical protein